MGKAKIMSHLGDGKYSILYQRDNSRAKQRIEELEDLKQELDDVYYGGSSFVSTSLYSDQIAKQQTYNATTQAFFWALEEWADCAKQLPPCEQHGALMQAVKDKGLARAAAGRELSAINAAIAKNRADHYAAQQEIAFLASTAQTDQDGVIMDAWCIDLDPENIIPNNTQVGTIESYGAVKDSQGGYLPKRYVNVVSHGQPAYSCAEHNRVQTAASMGVDSWFNNYCQWLYVMANNPKYAVGTIIAIDQILELSTVTLYGNTPVSSMPEGYPFDAGYSVTMVNVPCVYLNCGIGAFEVNDRVVIAFTGAGRSGPVIIGFASNPKLCKYKITYTVGAGGYLQGQTVQWLGIGQTGTPVTAVPDSCKQTGAWSPDGLTSATRQDTMTAAGSLAYQMTFVSNENLAPTLWILFNVLDRSGDTRSKQVLGYGDSTNTATESVIDYNAALFCGDGASQGKDIGDFKYYAHSPKQSNNSTYTGESFNLNCWEILEFTPDEFGYMEVGSPANAIGGVVWSWPTSDVVSSWVYSGYLNNAGHFWAVTASVTHRSSCPDEGTQLYDGAIVTDKTAPTFINWIDQNFPATITLKKKIAPFTEHTYYRNNAHSGLVTLDWAVAYTNTPP